MYMVPPCREKQQGGTVEVMDEDWEEQLVFPETATSMCRLESIFGSGD